MSAAPGGFKLRSSNLLSSTLLPVHSDILASLFNPEGQTYLLEVKTTPGPAHPQPPFPRSNLRPPPSPGDVRHARAVGSTVSPHRDDHLRLLLQRALLADRAATAEGSNQSTASLVRPSVRLRIQRIFKVLSVLFCCRPSWRRRHLTS